MPRIVVRFSNDRSCYGSIHVERNDGTMVAGPFPALGYADSQSAERHGNASRDSTKPYGNTPTGGYHVGGIINTGPGTAYNASTYGNQGALRMVPVSGDALSAKQNGRTGLLIHGGDLNSQQGLRPTFGCVRVKNADMSQIKSSYESLQLTDPGPGVCSVENVDINVIDIGPMTPGPVGPSPGKVDSDGDPPPGFDDAEDDS